jgi:hypothetical protein
MVAVFKKNKCVHHWAVQVVVALEGQGRQELGYDAAVVMASTDSASKGGNS